LVSAFAKEGLPPVPRGIIKTGQTGVDPIFRGACDFDLELIEHRTFDVHIQELIYWSTLHT
jgi:hypothetical protein